MRQILSTLALILSASLLSAQVSKTDTLHSIFQDGRKGYPELEPVSMMWVRPTIGSFFWGKMKYKVFVSTDTMYSQFVDTLSTDAILGWYAHELGHVVDYERRGRLGSFWMGVQYVFFPKGRARMEYRADKITIEHGYGCELLASVNISRKHLPSWKRKQAERFYLKRAQLEELIKICEQRKE